MKRFIALFVVASLLSGCGSEDTAAPHPSAVREVRYFLSNPGGLDTALAECRNNAGQLQDRADCANADEADRQRMFQQMEREINKQ